MATRILDENGLPDAALLAALTAIETIYRHAQGEYSACQLFQMAHDGFHAIEAHGAAIAALARKGLAGLEGGGSVH